MSKENSENRVRGAKAGKADKGGIGRKTARRAPVEEESVSLLYYMHSLLLLSGRLLNGVLGFYNGLFGFSNKDKATIHRNISNHYMSKGLYLKAIDSLKQWSRLERVNPEPHYRLGIALTAAGRDGQAIQMFENVLLMEQDHSDALYRKCKLHIKRKQHEEAIAGLERLLEIDPDNDAVLYLLGVTYSHLDRVDDATKLMKNAIDVNPEEVKYYQHLGFLHERSGEHKEAAECFSKVMELEDAHDDAIEFDLDY